ncbi:MAG: hypothetical protein IKO48_06050 [Elusimicrobia bacterium]|nr:hypothetical protein [Elusimicrobiota bacterium]
MTFIAGSRRNSKYNDPQFLEGRQPQITSDSGNHKLTATLVDNSSATAFYELLKKGPLTVDMHDYGSFEKVGPLGTKLPRNDTQITTQAGDIILYQGNQITIYYDTNSWNFTRLGYNDPQFLEGRQPNL